MKPWIFEVVALFIVLGCMFEGSTKGLVRKVFSLVRFLVRIIIAIGIVFLFFYFYKENLGLNKGIVFLIALACSSIIVYFLERLLGLIDKIPVVKQVNKLGGAVLGLLIGLLIVWIVIYAILSFAGDVGLKDVAKVLRKSDILMWVNQYNPMNYIFK